MSQLVGIFIVGVLSGWLIEWVFVRLFVPNPAAKLETALQNLRKENAVLQQQNRELQATLKPMPAPVPVNEPVTVEVAEAVAVVVAETVQAEIAVVEASTEAVVTEPSMTSSNDDLSRLSGIGPKLAEAMNAAGVTSYAQIATMDTEALTQALAGCTVRYSKAAAETWAAQAKLAMAGDWAGLKAYQASLKA